MKIEIKGNSQLTNSQFGDKNTMYVINEGKMLSESDWKELGKYLEEKIVKMPTNTRESQFVNQTLEIVQDKDERKLKNFIKENKDSFCTNVLSGMVVSGTEKVLEVIIGILLA